MTLRQRSGGRSDRSRRKPPDVSDALRENLGGLREQAAEQASALSQGLRLRSESLIEEQKLRAAGEIANLGAAIRRAADKLHDQKSDALAKYVDTAAETFNGVARYVAANDVTDLVHEIELFARRRPAVIVGSVFLAGLAVGRFVKAAQPLERSSSASSSSRNGRKRSSRKSPRRPVRPE
jgi:hypothetical protein